MDKSPNGFRGGDGFANHASYWADEAQRFMTASEDGTSDYNCVDVSDPPAAPPLNDYLAKRVSAPTGATVPSPDTNLQKGFLQAVTSLKQKGADMNHPKFGQLIYEIDNPPV